MDISINEREAWGQLKEPRKHTAAIGARMIDNRRRMFDVVGDRITKVGDEKVLKKLGKWLFGNKGRKLIAGHTRYSWGLEDANSWSDRFEIGNDIEVELVVRCAGEYCYVAAYADVVPPAEIGLMPLEETDGKGPRWAIDLDGCVATSFPRIFAKTKGRAMEMLVHYIENELMGRDDIRDEEES